MSELSMFLMENAEKVGTVKYVASKRFKDKGKPAEWEIKPIDSEKDDAIRKECTRKVAVAGKRGQYVPEVDTDKYTARMCAECTVYPNLNDAELQDNYGAKSAETLLRKMLLPGEYIEYKAKVMEVCGYDMSMEDLVEEAKN